MTIEPRHEVEANALINAHTYGIVREGYDGPIEEVTGPLLAKAIAAALAAAELRGRIEELTEAVALISRAHPYQVFEGLCDINARLAALQAESELKGLGLVSRPNREIPRDDPEPPK